jgi:hypothetical protein
MLLMKYLQIQNIMLAPAAVTALTFLLNIAANAVFIRMFGYQVDSLWNYCSCPGAQRCRAIEPVGYCNTHLGGCCMLVSLSGMTIPFSFVSTGHILNIPCK